MRKDLRRGTVNFIRDKWRRIYSEFLGPGVPSPKTDDEVKGAAPAFHIPEAFTLPYLAQHPSWIFAQEQIYENVWSEFPENCSVAAANTISRPRRKVDQKTLLALYSSANINLSCRLSRKKSFLQAQLSLLGNCAFLPGSRVGQIPKESDLLTLFVRSVILRLALTNCWTDCGSHFEIGKLGGRICV